MVAFNFMADFEPVLSSGYKTRTIRAWGKQGKKCNVGDRLQLYTGMRSKQCRKVADAICIGTAQIVIHQDGYELGGLLEHTRIQGKVATRGDDGRDFFQLDGFDNEAEFREFFKEQCGASKAQAEWEFKGFIYCWELV